MKRRTTGRVSPKRPNWQRNLLGQAIAMAGAGLQASAAMAACPAFPPDQTTTCFLVEGESVTIPAGSSISVPNNFGIFLDTGGEAGAGYTITNSGTVSGVPAGVVSDPASTGLVTITNNAGGLISGNRYGVQLFTGNSLVLINDGMITADDTNSTFSQSAAGLAVLGSLSEGSSITNSGTISGTADDAWARARATGIFIDELSNTSLTNNANSTISATASVSESDTYVSAQAFGVIIDSFGSAGVVTNSGTISATATADNHSGSNQASAYAAGVTLGGDPTLGSLTNNGSISASATAVAGSTSEGSDPFGGAYAVGLYVTSSVGVGAALTNNGSINATATSDDYAGATGIYVQGSLLGDGEGGASITNTATHTINASANGTNVSASGIAINGSVQDGATLTNAGTINVTATQVNGSNTASATGIYVNNQLAGLLSNSGTINVTANAGSTGFDGGEAYGIWVSSSIAPTGVLTNATGGTINVTATGEGATAAGIYISDSIAGTSTTPAPLGEAVSMALIGGAVTNGGTINVTANAVNTASAAGIYVSSSIQNGATLTNGGTINATATATNPAVGTSSNPAFASASAAGIYVGGELAGDISNSGTINVTATANAPNGISFAGAEAYGILLSSTVAATGSVTNATGGTISVTATGDSATAAGIWVDDSLGTSEGGSGAITNNGTITVNANGTTFASANGIFVDEIVHSGASITNAGTVTATAVATSGAASAGGIWVSELNGSIVNNGTITADGSNTGEGWAGVDGIYVNYNVGSGGSITNSAGHTINVTADGGSSSRAAGINVYSARSGSSITNAGTINAMANSAFVDSESGDDIGAAGIRIQFLDAGATVTNSGTINADTVDGGPGSGWAMYVNSGGGSGGSAIILNSGTMNGNVLLMDVSLNNSGRLSLPVVGEGFANYNSFIQGNYTQLAGGVLEIGAYSATEYGQLQFTGTADITASGHFAVKVAPNDELVVGDILQNVLDGSGELGGTLVDNPSNFFVTDDSAFWDFTAVDDGDHGIDLLVSGHSVPVLAAQSVQVANVNLDYISSIVMGRMDTRRVLVEHAAHDQNLWFRPYGTTGSLDGDNNVPGFDIDTYGMVVGYDNNVSDEWNVGGAFAYSNAQIESDDSQFDDKIDTDFYQGAIYAYWASKDHSYIDMMAIYGSGNNDSDRGVTAAVTANGDYDTWYTRASTAIGKGFPMNDKLTLTPSASLSYTYVEEDSYTEKGAAGSNLNVDDNDAQSLIFGLDGQLAYMASEGVLLTTHIGVGYDALTDEVSLTSSFVGGGTPFTTEGDKPDEWLGRAGVGAEMVVSDAIEVHVNYEYEYRDEFTDNLLAATLRWKI